MNARTPIATMILFLAAWPAAAEDVTVGGQTVAQDDMIVVQTHCNDLIKADGDDTGSATPQGFEASGGSTGPEAGQIAGDPAGDDGMPATGSGDGGAGSTLGAEDAPNVDLAAITLEACREAGLVR